MDKLRCLICWVLAGNVEERCHKNATIVEKDISANERTEVGHTLNSICMDELAVLVHSPAIVSASHSFAAGETYFYTTDAAHALPLVKVQNVTSANDIAVGSAGLEREVSGLPATRGAVC